MQVKIFFIAIIILIVSTFSIKAEDRLEFSGEILWEENPTTVINYRGDTISTLTFEDAAFQFQLHDFPIYTTQVALNRGGDVAVLSLVGDYAPIDSSEIAADTRNTLKTEIIARASLVFEQKVPHALISFIPIRVNEMTGAYERLVSYTIELRITTDNELSFSNFITEYAENSVLNQGENYQFRIQETGIYKLEETFFRDLGIEGTINMQDIKIYGYEGGILNEIAGRRKYDDLAENPIKTYDLNNNGVLDENDYVLFYGEGPVKWTYSKANGYFLHEQHYYSDYSYYFLSIDNGIGKRITMEEATRPAIDYTVTSFNDYQVHELDQYNLGESGRRWYGEPFNILLDQSFPVFTFPNLVKEEEIQVNARLAAKSFSDETYFDLFVNGEKFKSSTFFKVRGGFEGAKATTRSIRERVLVDSDNITARLVYNNIGGGEGWLDYITINARRQLKMVGGQMSFRDVRSVDEFRVSEFILEQAGGQVEIWEVSDVQNIQAMNTSVDGNSLRFTTSTEYLKEFIAFDGSSFLSAEPVGLVAPQNLHANEFPEMIIITHETFLEQAERLADHRRSQDNLAVKVVLLEQVYNEFSSGTPDLTAIRDYVKMYYDRAGLDKSKMPKYLLLFGDASYDYKNIKFKDNTNQNFIPTYQSYESASTINTFCTDDFYALLDDGEGTNMSSDGLILDIALGRLPVKTVGEAAGLVNKIIHYDSNASFGAWRNNITFIADDEDSNLHFRDAEKHSTKVDTTYNNYNINKIYCDAYPQLTTASGGRYPDVNEAIQNKLFTGTLIMNYTGHGGPSGWAEESILSSAEIQEWDNLDRLPLFITATCSFSKYDDPEETSAGELLILNPEGGAASIVTTVRLVYANSNYIMNNAFLSNAFKPLANGKMPSIGEITRLAKNQANNTDINNRKFTLLGDPAMVLAYPDYQVMTDAINTKSIANEAMDTLKALSVVEISGHISDANQQVLEDFNGYVYPTVYDKSQVLSTLKNDEKSFRADFSLQNNIVYKGKATVKDGRFNFSFVIPKDISYQYGIGRISYYADNGETDATGFSEDFIIGGIQDGLSGDGVGPEVNVFMNDEKFVFGGITNTEPVLVVKIKDEDGINTVGSGIGHDITGILDENNQQVIVLNEYYNAKADNYKEGEVRYPLNNLEVGEHSIEVKAWDVHNVSGKGYTEFIVAESAEVALKNVLNYPNPFMDKTSFWFEHNKAGQELTATVQIMTLSGRVVKTIREQFVAEGFLVDHLQWDGLDEFGQPIGRGTYIYRLTVQAADNTKADVIQKLVVLK